MLVGCCLLHVYIVCCWLLVVVMTVVVGVWFLVVGWWLLVVGWLLIGGLCCFFVGRCLTAVVGG